MYLMRIGPAGSERPVVLIEPEALADDAVLAEWVERGAAPAMARPAH